MLTVTSYSSDCCVPSRLDFEAAGDYVVRYFVYNYLLSGASSHCKHDVGALLWLNAEAVERAPTPLFGRLVRCSASGRFFARLRYICVGYILEGVSLASRFSCIGAEKCTLFAHTQFSQDFWNLETSLKSTLLHQLFELANFSHVK